MLFDDVEDHALNRGFLIAIQLFKLFVREGHAIYSFSIGDESITEVRVIMAVDVINLYRVPIDKRIIQTFTAVLCILSIAKDGNFVSLIIEREVARCADFKAGRSNAFNGVWFHSKGILEGEGKGTSDLFICLIS